MGNSDPITDIMPQIATEQGYTVKLCKMKETLENEVVAKKRN